MSDSKDELIKLLAQFDVETLTEDGIDKRHEALESEGVESTIGNLYRDLYDIHDRFKLLSQVERVEVLPHMFDLVERAGDLDFGSGAPGPITHAIETTSEFYLPYLLASLRRLPTPSSALMVNRWANSLETVDQLLPFLVELEKAAAHPKASVTTREDAIGFIKHQKSRLL
jgi:hypothetical protein